MLRRNDILLLLVQGFSIAASIFLPDAASVFQPYPLYGLMFFLFLSFLSIRLDDVRKTMRESLGLITFLTLLKAIILPIALYYLFRLVWPEYALAALLLSGISTGVVATFIAELVEADAGLVLVMVVISSPLVPFTLPVLVKILAGAKMSLSLFGMIRLLSLVVFVPLISVEILRRLSPGAMQAIMKRRFPISLVIFAIINLGIFSPYSTFYRQNPKILLEGVIVASLLAAVYMVTGVATFLRRPMAYQLAGGISLTNINNGLVLVFAAQFFGPREPTVAAAYMVPFFLSIIPMRLYQLWFSRRGTE